MLGAKLESPGRASHAVTLTRQHKNFGDLKLIGELVGFAVDDVFRDDLGFLSLLPALLQVCVWLFICWLVLFLLPETALAL